ncbi:DUF2938 domain-containing protein [Alteromonas sp. 07-89-2]|uniref:DUF2938 family protein n=1 Tax=Alteromonas sp. 07-89-2 TaxID=2607609 RepID=UPI00148CB70F|nr:DUF2938 family protein [Alteromonas sp. 07-89-2]NOH56644.1 DUF2938 domain-containing protein [Alteromonas sp. 07-89-2]
MSITLANKDDRTSLLILSVVLGVAATAFLDAMNYLQHIILDKPLTRYEFIGRWVIYMTDGVFSHQSIKAASPKAGELMLGWVGHYAIGIGFALLMLIFTGVKWVLKPSFLPAFIVGFATCSIPFFLMYPGMGYGIAGLHTPNPAMLQSKVLLSHFIFSVGLYAAGWLLSRRIQDTYNV